MATHFSPEAYRAALLEQLSAGAPEWEGTPVQQVRSTRSWRDEPSSSSSSWRFFSDPHDFGASKRPVHRETEESHGHVDVQSSLLLDTNGPCDHQLRRRADEGHDGCPHHHSMVIDFIDNCIANNVPEPVIARQVEFMISTMQEMIGMHTALQERFHKDRQREYEISQLANAVARQERLREQDRHRAVEERLESNRRRLGLDMSGARRTPSPPQRRAKSPPLPNEQARSPHMHAFESGTRSWKHSLSPSPRQRPNTRLSPLRYGRAAYHMISPKQRERAGEGRDERLCRSGSRGRAATPTRSPQRLWDREASPSGRTRSPRTPPYHQSRGTQRDSADRTDEREPVRGGLYPAWEEAPLVNGGRLRSRSLRYRQPTHASVAHRSTSRSVPESGVGDHGRNCPSCHREDSRHHRGEHPQPHRQLRKVPQNRTNASMIPKQTLGEQERRRARTSVLRETKASLLRAEAAARKRLGKPNDEEADDDVNVDKSDSGVASAAVREGPPPCRPAPAAPPSAATSSISSAHFTAPPPLPNPPRPSIEKRNGFSDSRHTSSGSQSFADMLRRPRATHEACTQSDSLQTRNTLTGHEEEDGASGGREESPSFFVDQLAGAADAAARRRSGNDFEALLKQRASEEGAPAYIGIEQRLRSRRSTGEAPAPVTTSPELQLFIETSQRKIRESERLVARTSPNVSAIVDASTPIGGVWNTIRSLPTNPSASSALSGASFTVYTPPRTALRHAGRDAPPQPAVPEAHSPMVEISPTSSDDD